MADVRSREKTLEARIGAETIHCRFNSKKCDETGLLPIRLLYCWESSKYERQNPRDRITLVSVEPVLDPVSGLATVRPRGRTFSSESVLLND